MPMIDARFSVSMSPAQEQELKTRLGKAIECIPGKNESWLMIGLTPDACLYFRGEKGPAAWVEVSVFGGDSESGYAAMTAEVCRIFEEVLGIPADRVYVRYGSTRYWGWNGGNF